MLHPTVEKFFGFQAVALIALDEKEQSFQLQLQTDLGTGQTSEKFFPALFLSNEQGCHPPALGCKSLGTAFALKVDTLCVSCSQKRWNYVGHLKSFHKPCLPYLRQRAATRRRATQAARLIANKPAK